MDDQRPPSLMRGMWLRFTIAALLIIVLSGTATATVALNTASTIAHEIFPAANHIATPKGLVTEVYGGGPQTFLVLGSDRRAKSKDSYDRTDPPHSDTILLVRFDPEQGQTSVLSIPRDLMVNIKTPSGEFYPEAKINAAYTYGSELGGTDGGIVLAAETIEREVFPELKGQLNGIIDVNFQGFINVVDTLGCAYVNVDHRYLGGGALDEDYSSINLEPGYQKLCYEDALSYVRYRHDDSDFVRVARQQDFLRDLREQVSPSDLENIGTIAKAVGKAIKTNFKPSASELLTLSKLIAFSQQKPLRQVKFKTTSVDAMVHGESYVTSSPELERETLADFLHGREQPTLPKQSGPSHASRPSHRHGRTPSSANAARALNLYPTEGEDEAVKASLESPVPFLYPTLQVGSSEQQQVRAYPLVNQQKIRHHAYVIVWRLNGIGGYYDFEGTDWLNPPLFAHARTEILHGQTYMLVDDGSHIHVIGWRQGNVLYWLTNTLLEELSNSQMFALAKSAQPLQ